MNIKSVKDKKFSFANVLTYVAAFFLLIVVIGLFCNCGSAIGAWNGAASYARNYGFDFDASSYVSNFIGAVVEFVTIGGMFAVGVVFYILNIKKENKVFTIISFAALAAVALYYHIEKTINLFQAMGNWFNAFGELKGSYAGSCFMSFMNSIIYWIESIAVLAIAVFAGLITFFDKGIFKKKSAKAEAEVEVEAKQEADAGAEAIPLEGNSAE